MSKAIKGLLAAGVGNAADVGYKRRVLLSPEEAVAYLGNILTVQTLANRRMRGLRPVWVKIGSRVGYEIEELDSWVVACRVVLPDVNPASNRVDAAVALITAPADEPKRGRGRPRKVPPPAAEVPLIAPPPDPPKRGRGRSRGVAA